MRLTGRSDAAVALYQKALKANPSDADALAGLAETWMHEFRQSGDRHVLETAMDAAQKAGQADPSIWKPLFSLATMHYLAGDVAAAIRTSEEALARDVNEYVRSEEHTSELQSLMRISYAVFCLKNKKPH